MENTLSNLHPPLLRRFACPLASNEAAGIRFQFRSGQARPCLHPTGRNRGNSAAFGNTLQLSREMKILETNIHLLTQCLLDEANTGAAVVVEGIDRCAPEGSHRWKLVLSMRSSVDSKLSNLLNPASIFFIFFCYYLDAFERDERLINLSLLDSLQLVMITARKPP